jgi:ABC-type transport system involved in multi-copper enzyme maturation permease subunit
MLRFLKKLGLPLLGKELIEQAARKRTYIIRAVYATILFLTACLFFFEILMAASASPLAALGRGKDMVSTLVGLQFAGVYFFMPAMTCGVIAQEKERDSLQLLFLTRLGPWTIVFEKLLGRMVPMLGFLLLSLPLLAFAYTLGGVSPYMLWSGVWMLVVAIIQMGTLALMCSAFCRTTVGAFLSSYVLAFVMFFGPYFLFMMLILIGLLLNIPFEELLSSLGLGPSSQGIFFLLVFPFFGPPIYYVDTLAPGIFGTVAIGAHTVINLGVSAGFLMLARRFLVSRAFVPHRSVLLRAFKAFDRKKPRKPLAVAAKATVKSPVFSADALLPGDQPIVWRETKKRMLGSWKYIARVLLIVEIPVILFCGLLVTAEIYSRQYNNYVPVEIVYMLSAPMHFLMWSLAVLIVSVKSASLIAAERTHQTLDVLCTTPVTGRQIVREKMHGVWRVILVAAVPFVTVFVFKAFRLAASALLEGRHFGPMDRGFDPFEYLVCQALSFAILLPLVAWLSLLIGLKVRTQGRAIMASMAAIVGWCVGPLIFIVTPLTILFPRQSFPNGMPEVIELAWLLSPATVVFANEVNVLNEFQLKAWGMIAVNFAIYGILLFWFRRICLVHADRWLGRLEAEKVNPGSNSANEERGEKRDERDESSIPAASPKEAFGAQTSI